MALTTAPVVAMDQTAQGWGKVKVSIGKLQAMTSTAQGIGEVSGPAVALTVVIDNQTGAPLDISHVNVNVQDKSGLPSSRMMGSPSRPFSGSLGAGKSATAVYVFSLAADHKNPVQVTIGYTTQAPIVQFVGDVK